MNLPNILTALPMAITSELYTISERYQLEEVHLRLAQKTEVVASRRSILLSYRTTQQDLRIILERATNYSLYAAQGYLKEGFCTTKDGCRLGIAGTVTADEQGTSGIHDVSSVCIRVAREMPGVADAALKDIRIKPGSILITGGPGCGKTTLLRDLIRQLSDCLGYRIGVADTRFELAAAFLGKPYFNIGERVDILSGGTKESSIMLLLRTMSPQWIAMDEITCAEDVHALEHCSYCGVWLMATAHAFCKDDLYRRPVYRTMMEKCIFRYLIEMEPSGAYRLSELEV